MPISSKLFERLFLKRLQPVIETLNLIPEHQFGFRRQHSTVEQMHRLAHYIRQCLEEKQFCSSVFLDVRQAFDKVWHIGLLYKIKKLLPHSFYNLIQSYLTDRKFKIAFQGEQTDQFNIESGVPQGSVLGPMLYVLYTSDIPKDPNTMMETFADDTAILSKNVDCVVATENLQNGLNNIQSWLNKWRIQVNETKSTHVVFTLKNENSPRVTLNNILLPQSESVKYLGMHLDKRLTWKNHIWNKRLQLDLKRRKLSWLINKHSKLSLKNKVNIYKVILKPVWSYGIELWGTASVSNIEIIQRFQSKCLRQIVNAPWYVSNKTLHSDLKMPYVNEEISKHSKKYQRRLENHANNLALNLLDNSNDTYRLKRANILDLPFRFAPNDN